MGDLITLPKDPCTIPGVASVRDGDESMVVNFTDGHQATVKRSPLAAFSGRDRFDVWMPPTTEGGPSWVAPSKSPAEVVAMLADFAAKAAVREGNVVFGDAPLHTAH